MPGWKDPAFIAMTIGLLFVIGVGVVFAHDTYHQIFPPDPCFVIVHVNSSHGTWIDNSHYIPSRCDVRVVDDYLMEHNRDFKPQCVGGCSP